MGNNTKDKAGKEYWDCRWEEKDLPEAMNPHLGGLKNLYNRRVDKLLKGIFADTETKGKKILEVGCAMSVFLPYFAKEFSFEITGIDYSEIGCEQERQILSKAKVEGEIFCADFFKPPEELLEKFDYLFSFGVAEHFVPTERCLEAFAGFLKPGGKMITIIPNMTGSIGKIFKILNRPVYDIHVVLDNKQLQKAHENIGLKVEKSDYFLSTGFGMANIHGLEPTATSTKLKDQLFRNLGRMSVFTWALEDKIINLPNTKFLSPYICCLAQKS